MKLQHVVLISLLPVLFALTQAAVASGTQSEKIMAKILVNLNHYPAASEKTQLSNIAKHGDEGEKIVATAILNLQHSASSADKKQLKQVMNDSAASASLKDIAGVVYRLSHQPNRSDKKVLNAILD